MMPVARYFLFVGGALLALLFAFDAFVPNAAADLTTHAGAGAGVDKSVVRIRSEQKWPEAIVFDTSQPTIVLKAEPVQVAVAAPAPAAEISAKARVRETFAQFTPVEPKRADAKADVQGQRKRKIVKNKVSQPMRLAQQSPAGFFGSSTW